MAAFLAQPREAQAHLATSPHKRVAATLRKGNVLLVEGTSRFSSAIKYLTHSTRSHAALYIGDRWDAPEDNEPPRVLADVDVIEGVRVSPLETFPGWHTRIRRPIGLSDEAIDRLIDFMFSRVGYMYALKNIVDLARYLIRTPPLPGGVKSRFIALGSGAPMRAICSKFLAQEFESLRYPILPEIELIAATPPLKPPSRRFCTFATLACTRRVTSIFRHFFAWSNPGTRAISIFEDWSGAPGK